LKAPKLVEVLNALKSVDPRLTFKVLELQGVLAELIKDPALERDGAGAEVGGECAAVGVRELHIKLANDTCIPLQFS
jgi:hypothetical protein